MKDESESDLSEEINDQLSQLWSTAKDKRKQLLSHLTPYSKRNQNSFNSSLLPRPETSFKGTDKDKSHLESQVTRLRDQLEQQVSQGRNRQLEMDRLKKTAQQLSMEKKYLARQLHHNHNDENNSKVLNESSILPRGKSNSPHKQKPKQNRSSKQAKQTIDRTTIDKLQDLSKQRLVQLVRATSQYRSYVFYYDSNELSYLRRLQEQHKKNCGKTPGEKQKSLWGPKDLVQEMRGLCLREELSLSEHQLQTIISRLKGLFESNSSNRLSKLKEYYQGKLQKASRASQNSIPYDLVQVTRARQRQLSRWNSSKRSATVLK